MFNGSLLRKLRKDEGLTMKEFGAIFNLAESTISGYENGTRKPDLDIVDKFASHFEVSVDFLMGRIPSNTMKDDILMDESISAEDKTIILEFRKLEKKDQDYFMELIKRIQKK